MKRKYVYIIAVVLCTVFVVSSYYVDLSIEDVISLEQFETKRFLDTSDIDEALNLNNKVDSEKQDNDVQDDDKIPVDNDVDFKGIGSTGTLVIKNVQNDNKVMSYTYKIVISDVSGAYRYKYNDTQKYIIFSANGEAEITMNSNESITIYDLPKGAGYILEQVGGNSSKYTITANRVVGTKSSGIIGDNSKVTFENKIPVKDGNKNPTNPYTADIYTLGIILFIITTIIFLAIRRIKINRFE